MRRRKKILWISVGFFLFVGASALYLRAVAEELEAKFNGAIDSVPTKVYSALFVLKRGTAFSLDELKARLRERDYQELKDWPQKPSRGTYSLQQDGNSARLRIFLNEFLYPVSVRGLLLPDSGGEAGDAAPLLIDWQDGQIERIAMGPAESEREIPAAALEPVMVAQLSADHKESRKIVPLHEIPHTLSKAIVSVEDQRFLDHMGIDPRGILRSMYVNLRAGGYVQGASTITQQLIRNIYLTRAKTLTRKFREIILALMIEYKYSKDEILEKYLNEVYFGQSGNLEIHGVSEAAKFYFGKNLGELSIAEQALLAGVVRGPFYYSPYRHPERAKQRQEIVLKKMLEMGAITQTEYQKAIKVQLKFVKTSHIQDRAPYFTDMVRAQLLKDLPEQELAGAGYKIFSTVDTYYQTLAEKAVQRGIDNLEARLSKALTQKKATEADKRILQGAFIVLNPANNHLLAIVGGRSYEESNYNRALFMRRQVGSIFKPFVYLAALVYGKNPDDTPMNTVSKVEDKPFTYEYDKQSWSPRNYEDEYLGEVTLRFALARSLNTPTARIAVSVGLQKVVELARAAGIETKLDAIPALSLGAVELTPMEVLQSYSTIANAGLKREIVPIIVVVKDNDEISARFIPKEEQALPAAETANLLDMLTTVFTDGTARYSRDLGFKYPTAAGKTGTTNDYRDSWFVGLTPRLLSLGWVGFDRDDEQVRQQRKMLKLTGAVGALPIWVDFMSTAHKNIPTEEFNVPNGLLRRANVDIISGGLANSYCAGINVVSEVFTHKNVPHYECPARQ